MKKNFLIIIFLILTLSSQSHAGFVGPTEVLSAVYGSGNGQVGLRAGDSGDEFPWRIAVSPMGRIALCDEANDRVVLYKADGTFERNINILSTGVVFDSSDALYFKAKFRKFNQDGTMVFEKDAGYHEIFLTDNSVIGYDKDKKTYSLYSPTGQLISTSTTKPAELGQVKEQALGGSRYKITITYPDKTYSILGGPFERYQRDLAGRLNAISGKYVKKVNECGKELGKLIIPEDESQIVRPGGGGHDERRALIAEYGDPVVAPNGDVYTWKRTPTNYSILKWTWQDDPNVPTGPDAPTNLTLMPSTTGLYLTWAASPQDPGCVTGYEVSRATSAGGVGTTIATLVAGQLKYSDTTAEAGTTYYYKVRAKAGSEYSVYTAEVSGRR